MQRVFLDVCNRFWGGGSHYLQLKVLESRKDYCEEMNILLIYYFILEECACFKLSAVHFVVGFTCHTPELCPDVAAQVVSLLFELT